MARQNRVTPWAEIIATPERGTLMGNRGLLHDDHGRIRRPWRLQRWLLCVLEFRGRKRTVMTPGRYTELFFLDEATGLAAGHRPCAECRREDYNAFRRAWATSHKLPASAGLPSADAIDDELHASRLKPDGSQRCFTASLDELPEGVFVRLDDGTTDCWLLWGGKLWAWSPGGYHERRPRRRGQRVQVLTPLPTVKAIQAGYIPAVHPSAGSA